MEPKVTLQFRQKDQDSIEKAVKEASAEYEKEFGYPVEVVYDTTYLPEFW